MLKVPFHADLNSIGRAGHFIDQNVNEYLITAVDTVFLGYLPEWQTLISGW